jgi:signal peptidase II
VFKKALLISFFVLLIDQFVKIYIKTNYILDEEYAVAGNWFILHFTENNGMAFGLELQGSWGKLILTTFRIIAISALVYYLYYLCKTKAHKWYIYSIALVFAGALGNIIDSVFYGVIFNDSYQQVASFMPAEGGYSSLMFGKVVDMLYFPIIHGQFPAWFPIWGGENFEFFSPIFNIADFAISCGVGIMILNNRKFFDEEKKIPDAKESQEVKIKE